MNDRDVYLLFSAQFRSLDDNLDDLVAQATGSGDVDPQEIIDAWHQANANYLSARNKVFAGQGPVVDGLIQDFENAQGSITDALTRLKSQATTIKQVAGIISAGVDKGTALLNAGRPLG